MRQNKYHKEKYFLDAETVGGDEWWVWAGWLDEYRGDKGN